MNTGFDKNFIWGVASSAYQIEGASNQDGRGLSVWDQFCHTPGKVLHGDKGDLACDHYNRLNDDIELISNLGVNAYRFSISWPRIIPSGDGVVNSKGVDFYDRLIDGLLERGVEPWITLFHWDFPLDLYRRGGWLNRDSANWFADYTKVVVDKFSDRVSKWITLNEPQCFLGLGHDTGEHAPGLELSMFDLLTATHNALLAHGSATQVIRNNAKIDPVIGWSPVGVVTYPFQGRSEFIEPAREAMFSIPNHKWFFNNIWYSDPVILGKYPEKAVERFEQYMPKILDGDMKLISQPLDFYGLNIYHGAPLSFEVDVDTQGVPKLHQRAPGHPQTQMGWTIDPEALYWGPKFIQDRYKLPIYITENGIASMDWIHADGKVPDDTRIDYLLRHLQCLRKAKCEGVDIRGYFQWSIMDNYEWELGYSKRFGLVYVDYETMERRPKKSYHWYKNIIKTNGESLSRKSDNLR